MNNWTDDAWSKRHEVIYKCQLSALYHRKRERFYSLLDKASSTFALIAGSAAMSEFLPTPEVKSIAGGIVAIVTIPSVVFSWAEKSKDHAVLASRFIALEAETEGSSVQSLDGMNRLLERVIAIEAEEPPAFPTLTRICQNEIARASDHERHISSIPPYKRWLANWMAI